MHEKAGSWFRRWARRVWRVRGGGLYALGYIVTFVLFEIRTIAGEIASSSGVGDFVSSQLAEFVMRVAVDSILNMVLAFIWPVYVLLWHPLYDAIALGLAYLGFSRFLKPPIERWLFADESAPASPPADPKA